MITQRPTEEMLEAMKSIWIKYKDKLHPNRKSGMELLEYLLSNYSLTEIYDKNAINSITYNIIMNKFNSEKLPNGVKPVPRAFYLENSGNGERFYLAENEDPIDLWGVKIKRIFVGIDISSGFYMVEGSTMLWDELCAFRGIDEKDLQNIVCVAEYIKSLKRFGLLEIEA